MHTTVTGTGGALLGSTMTTAGDVNTQVGMAAHIYLVTKSMEDAYFYSADSELLIVPQVGRLRFCRWTSLMRQPSCLALGAAARHLIEELSE